MGGIPFLFPSLKPSQREGDSSSKSVYSGVTNVVFPMMGMRIESQHGRQKA
jgi:hypothetical protein